MKTKTLGKIQLIIGIWISFGALWSWVFGGFEDLILLGGFLNGLVTHTLVGIFVILTSIPNLKSKK